MNGWGSGGILLALIALGAGCTDKKPSPARPAPVDASVPKKSPPPKPTPTRSWAALNETDARCADCHPQIVERWQASPMGQSVGPVQSHGPGEAVHPRSGVNYSVEHAASGFRQVAGKTGETRKMDLAIGSGRHTQSYLSNQQGRLFQLPLTWYSNAKKWDLSPGYAQSNDLGFTRRVREECVGCHASFPAQTRADVYADLPKPIGCNRCHGDSAAHVAGRVAGGNTAALKPDDTVCQSCHLQGTVRVLNPGKRWRDFRPGMALGDLWTVFVREDAGADFGIASQSERLALSECAKKSGLTCTTCHDPHGVERDRSAACRDCHSDQHPCSEERGPDCAKCHMARGATHDVPHVSAADHFIRRAPRATTPSAKLARPPTDSALRPAKATPNPPAGSLGRAYAEAFRQRGDPRDAQRGMTALDGAPEDPRTLYDKVFLARVSNKPAVAAAALDSAFAKAPTDWRIAVSTARQRLQTAPGTAVGTLDAALAKHPDEAELWYAQAQVMMGRPAGRTALERALALSPTHPGALVLRALLREVSGDVPGAVADLTRAVGFHPRDRLTRIAAGELALRRGKHAEADTHYEALVPDPEALVGRARAALGRGDVKSAQQHYATALAAGSPPNPGVLGRLALAANDFASALPALERAAEQDPSDPDVWSALSQAREKKGDAAGAKAAAEMARAPTPTLTSLLVEDCVHRRPS